MEVIEYISNSRRTRLTQLSITTQEIKDLSLKTMRDVANSWKGEKVSVQNDVAVRIAVKYFETLLENPTEQEQVVNQRDTNSDHGSNLPTALRAQKRYLWTWVIYRRKCI
jgi:hypothetical protein